MQLTKFPRRKYTETKTPIEKLGRLSELLGGPNLYIKRDDLLGLASGGNKTRKLEYIMADALAKGADTVITCGSLQSNHCRLTLAAAVKEGLDCHLILEETAIKKYDEEASGNNFLYKLLGAKVHVFPNGTDKLAEMDKLCEKLTAEGKSPYPIPVGGSNELGTIGYSTCALEIIEQSLAMEVDFHHIVAANGSGSTTAGLLLGLFGRNENVDFTAISVSGRTEEVAPKVFELVEETAKLLEIEVNLPKEKIHFYDEYVGEGYAIPTEAMIEAVQLVARTEGILLDPVYTGKVFSGLIDLIRKGKFKQGENVLFVHSGGSPALYDNMNLF